MSRHSLKNLRRLVRASLGAESRTGVRYGHDAEVTLRLGMVRRWLLQCEKQLGFAIRNKHRQRDDSRRAA